MGESGQLGITTTRVEVFCDTRMRSIKRCASKLVPMEASIKCFSGICHPPAKICPEGIDETALSIAPRPFMIFILSKLSMGTKLDRTFNERIRVVAKILDACGVYPVVRTLPSVVGRFTLKEGRAERFRGRLPIRGSTVPWPPSPFLYQLQLLGRRGTREHEGDGEVAHMRVSFSDQEIA